jgi:hypothetical protein
MPPIHNALYERAQQFGMRSAAKIVGAVSVNDFREPERLSGGPCTHWDSAALSWRTPKQAQNGPRASDGALRRARGWRRALQQAQQVRLSRRTGLGEDILQVGSHRWLADAEHIRRFLAAQALRQRKQHT